MTTRLGSPNPEILSLNPNTNIMARRVANKSDIRSSEMVLQKTAVASVVSTMLLACVDEPWNASPGCVREWVINPPLLVPCVGSTLRSSDVASILDQVGHWATLVGIACADLDFLGSCEV